MDAEVKSEDFYEDDEPLEKILALAAREPDGHTAPSGPGSGAPPQVTFGLPAELRAKVEARAAAEGKKVSDIAREALERYVS